jgi:hypothetical protein
MAASRTSTSRKKMQTWDDEEGTERNAVDGNKEERVCMSC